MQKVVGSRGGSKAQLAMMKAMMDQMGEGSVPTLRTIIGHEHFVSVRASANVREAATIMANTKKATLVMDASDLVGILTPHDILKRVVTRGKSPDLTAVSTVMTPDPLCVSADLTLLDALREMHDHKFMYLIVRDDDGSILGVLDVIELLHETAGGEGGGKSWREFFSDAIDARGDDDSDKSSEHSSIHSINKSFKSNARGQPAQRLVYYDEDEHSDIFSIGIQDSNSTNFIFKFTDEEGHTHRIKSSSTSMVALQEAVAEKVDAPLELVVIKYVDEEKDEVILSSDSSLKDAVKFAKVSGLTCLKILVHMRSASPARSRQSFDRTEIPFEAAIKATPGGQFFPAMKGMFESPVVLGGVGVVVLLSVIGLVVVGSRGKK